MPNLKGLTFKKTDVSQIINLEDIFGVSFAGEKSLRLAIAQKVIDHIVKRTESGESAFGGSFKPYSQDYKNTADFKLLKSGDNVDMKLTGAMLNDINLLSDSANTIRIGFEDELEKLKAFNHNTGDTVPRRQFFGISEREVKEVVMEDFSDDIARLEGRDPAKQTVKEIMEQGVLRKALDILNNQDNDFVFNTIEDL